MFHTRLRRAAAVALLMGAAAVVGPSPAEASSCPGTAGVTVVVEFRELGRGSAQSCVADGGGRTADRLLKDAGYALDYVQRFPGFVCRLDGEPADDPCVNTPPADAYWGLWWSDGTSGKWTYSSLGAASLTLPSGGYVAMVWDGSTGTVSPASTPAVHPTPTPTKRPTVPPPPTRTPTTTPSATTTATPTTATASPTTKPTQKPTRKPTEKPTPSDPPTATPSDEPTHEPTDLPPNEAVDGSSDDDGGLPGWVPPVLVVALLGVAGAVAVVRRRR